MLRRDWKKIVRHAWSIRWMLAGGLFSGGEVALPILQPILPIPSGWFAAVSGLCVSAAFVSRLIAQKQFEED